MKNKYIKKISERIIDLSISENPSDKDLKKLKLIIELVEKIEKINIKNNSTDFKSQDLQEQDERVLKEFILLNNSSTK